MVAGDKIGGSQFGKDGGDGSNIRFGVGLILIEQIAGDDNAVGTGLGDGKEQVVVSLAELGAMMDPPIGKSGMRHRLDKIAEFAKSLQ